MLITVRDLITETSQILFLCWTGNNS